MSTVLVERPTTHSVPSTFRLYSEWYFFQRSSPSQPLLCARLCSLVRGYIYLHTNASAQQFRKRKGEWLATLSFSPPPRISLGNLFLKLHITPSAKYIQQCCLNVDKMPSLLFYSIFDNLRPCLLKPTPKFGSSMHTKFNF